MLPKYINPIYRDFDYTASSHQREVVAILSALVERYQGVMPNVRSAKQLETVSWDRKSRKESPRLVVSWDVRSMNDQLYGRLEEIFKDSVLDGSHLTSRAEYKSRGHAPAHFVGLDAGQTGKIRGYPMYEQEEFLHDKYDLTRATPLLWVARTFPSVGKAQDELRRRGRNYWFNGEGNFLVDLRMEECREIEFVDTALRASVALNGSYDSFNRAEALSLAQKHLARRNTDRIMQSDVMGLDDLIEDIKFRLFFANIRPDEARALGVTDESVLLVGVPGTGKSSVASSLLWDPVLEPVSFIPVNVTELLKASYSSDMEVKGFFQGIRDLNRRYGLKPRIWCDDLEAAFLEDRWSGSKEMAVTQATLLNHLQGVSKDLGMRISGSTNFPERIDPRFLEFGRISYMFHVPIPKDPRILTDILGSHISKRGQVLASGIEVEEIAARSVGYTPRMLVNLVNEAGVQAGKRIFGRFESKETSEAVEVTEDDYRQADSFLRQRSDLLLLARRDEEIGEFVAKHNRRLIGY